MSLKSTLAGAVALAALVAPTAAQADQIGPDPTVTSIRQNGTFAYDRIAIGDGATPGFGKAQIWAPKDTSRTYGAVAIAPGWTENMLQIQWLGPRLASHGFAVIAFDVTNTFTDLPPVRGSQLLRAVDYFVNTSPFKSRIDGTRVAVMGHSMGGGGALEASYRRPSLKAAVPLTPWSLNTNFSRNTVPTMIISAQNDIIAPVASHTNKFYNSIPATTSKALFEYAGADHFITNSANPTVGAGAISWLKRFVDGDTRYSQFITPSATFALPGKQSKYLTSGTL